MTKENKDKALKSIELVDADGGTSICEGLKSALSILNDRKQPNSVTSIFLLSDGLDYEAKNVKNLLRDFTISTTYTIHTFGYGSDHDPKLMTSIADMGDGNFYFVNNFDTLDDCFIGCLGGRLHSIGENALINIGLTATAKNLGVKINKAYSGSSMWKAEGDCFKTRISNIVAGKQKDYVLELTIPPLQERSC
jgi:von Willebrand factor type A domain.